MTVALGAVGLASALALVSLGGGLYEFSVVDPAWPRRPDMIQPDRGGVSRKWFWIPAHVAFELTLVAALVLAWSSAEVRGWLWTAMASHLVMRLWSAVDFIPKALAFERAEPAAIDEASARRWTRRSRLRLPLDVVTCTAMLTAFAQAARLG
jgi:hypothetical protein